MIPKDDGEIPKRDGVIPKDDGVIPKDDGVIPKDDGVIPKRDGVSAKLRGVSAKLRGVSAQTNIGIAQTCGYAFTKKDLSTSLADHSPSIAEGGKDVFRVFGEPAEGRLDPISGGEQNQRNLGY